MKTFSKFTIYFQCTENFCQIIQKFSIQPLLFLDLPMYATSRQHKSPLVAFFILKPMGTYHSDP